MANPFSNITEKLSGLFKSSSKGASVVGVDIGSSAMKVVQLRNKGGVAVLETYGELSLGPYAGVEIGRATNLPSEKIAEALTDLLREANVTATAAGVSIPFSSSLISLVELPRVPEGQLASMIPIEARKYIPVPIGEVTLDWFVVPDEEAQYLTGESKKQQSPDKVKVLLVAIHNETLSKYQRIIEQSNLSASFFEIEIFSAARAVLEQGVKPVAIIDIGAASTKLYIVEYGVVRLSHNINKGAQDITLALSRSLGISVEKAERLKRKYGITGADNEEADLKQTSQLTLDYIFSEANRTILSYQRKYNKNVSSAILTGGGAIMEGLLPFTKEYFDMPVELGNPFSKVEAPAFLGDVLNEAGPEFSVAVGLALRKLQERA